MVYIYIGPFRKEPTLLDCRKMDILQTPVSLHGDGDGTTRVFVRRSSERPPWTLFGPYCL